MSGDLVTIGVPVYRGQDTVAETLACLQGQTHRELDVLISVDGPDDPSVEACRPFLEDARFRLEVHPERAGWAANMQRTIDARRGAFYLYQQQDDIASPTYVADLLAATRRWPQASICYAEMDVSGQATALVRDPHLVGEPLTRALTHLEQLHTSMFRGLIPGWAIERVSPLRSNPHDDFCAEHPFMAGLALAGEFRLVDGPTYYKRLHGGNLHLSWLNWSPERRRDAWANLAAGLAGVIVPAGGSPPERWRLLFTVLHRFLVRQRGRWTYLDRDPTPPSRGDLLAAVKREFRADPRCDLPALLGGDWSKIERRIDARFGPAGASAPLPPSRRA